MASQGRIEAPISSMRRLMTSVVKASVAISTGVIAGDQISIDTICETPANTMPLISIVSNSVRPFCAASAPKAAPNSTTPGKRRHHDGGTGTNAVKAPGRRRSAVAGQGLAGLRLHGCHVESEVPRSSKRDPVGQCY